MKMPTILLLALCLVAVAAASRNQERIVGGSTTTISQYPHIVSLLYSSNLSTYSHKCGGVILNTRSILTAAQCPVGDTVNRWRARVGSTFASSGGFFYNFQSYNVHPSFVAARVDNDVAIMRTATIIFYVNNIVQPATIAGANYNIADNSAVWAAGWGDMWFAGSSSEILLHVQVWTINQNTCFTRYREYGHVITDNMLCAGLLDFGGRGQCEGDTGGPLHHGGVVVGIYSWSRGCAHGYFPGVNTRVSRFSTWIQQNA